MNKPTRSYLFQDLIIIAVSICVAILLVKTQAFDVFLKSTKDSLPLSSFVAGLFFTSIFTTAPAIIALTEIAHITSIFYVAFFGALGAMMGDFLIFRFMRDRLGEHLTEVIQHQLKGNKIHFKHHLKLFKWGTFFIGGLIIASPLPDEIGIGLLGFSKMKTKWFVPLSFIFNFIGILFVGMIANSI
jgi:hypothetical protein